MRAKALAPYDRIYRSLLALLPDLLAMRPGDYVRLAAPGFLDLHVDVLERDEKWLRLSLAHHWTLNGDTMADPDMEVRVSRDPAWPVAEALSFQQDAPPVYTVVYPTPQTVNTGAKRDLNAFLARTWLPNLKRQGHRVVEVRRANEDATAPEAGTPEGGRSHAEEPDDTDDVASATWFDADHDDSMPPEGPDRLRWHSKEILRHGIEHEVYAATIAEALKAGTLGEAAAWAALAAKLKEAGCHTYHSDTRFLAWKRGQRIECPACTTGACKSAEA